MTIDNAQVIEPDIFASNGVVHVIDSVILRPSDQPVKAVSNELVKAVANQPNKAVTNQPNKAVANKPTEKNVISNSTEKTIANKPTEKTVANQQPTPVSLIIPNNAGFYPDYSSTTFCF